MPDDPLHVLASEPGRAAILLDVDGTLAPIVAGPENALIPDETRAELARLTARYALVACVSGRPGAEVERMLGVPGVAIVGEHGLELEPDAAAWAERIRRFARGVDWPSEAKPLSASFHFRRADDEAAARAYLTRVAEDAAAAGLVPRWGRMVLEVRPPVDAHKGTAVRTLVARAGAVVGRCFSPDVLAGIVDRPLPDLEASIAEQTPHRQFGVGGLVAHFLRETAEALGDRSMAWWLQREPLTRRLTS